MQLAVNGGTPVRTKGWPKWPIWGSEEEEALLSVLHGGQWWRVGAESVGKSKIVEFERKFAQYQSAKYGVCVTTGTDALEIAIRAARIGCGDEVIIPPYTFIATATAVLTNNASPIFVDIEPNTYLINPKAIEAAITPRTKAIIPVHIAGRPCDMDAINDIAKKYNLIVIEDSAQAHGAEWKGTKVGAIGDMGIFSFQASKNVNAGEGGIILTNNEAFWEACWSVHNVGRTPKGAWYEHHILGGNNRMTEWQGAILLAQLDRLEEQNLRRQDNAKFLSERLLEIDGIIPLDGMNEKVTSHAYHLFISKYHPDKFNGKPIDWFFKAMRAEGIPCTPGYVPLYHSPLFKNRSNMSFLCKAGRMNYNNVHCPVCEQAQSEAVWMTQNMLLGDRSDMDDIANAVEKVKQCSKSA